MATPRDCIPGAGLWSISGTGPPSPRSGVSQNFGDQRPVGQVLTPKPIPTPVLAQPKTPSRWTSLCRCQNCCVCCGYDFCARCCCPCTCCRCCCWLFIIIVLFVLAVGLVVLALWKILHPKFPTYNVDNASFSYTLTASILNAQTAFVMEIGNPNTAIGIYYDQIKLNIKMFSLGIGNQIIPPFYDGYSVTKYININMASGPVTLNSANQVALADAVTAANLPLNLIVDVKVRLKIGKWATPQLKVQLNCALSIDPGAASGSQLKDMKCGFSLKL